MDWGRRFDFGGVLALQAGESFATPQVAFTPSASDLDDAANQLHRCQREYVVPRTPTNDPVQVQFRFVTSLRMAGGPAACAGYLLRQTSCGSVKYVACPSLRLGIN